MSNQIPIYIEENIYQEAAKVLEPLELTISDTVNLLLTKIVQEKTLPFDILIFNQKTSFFETKKISNCSRRLFAFTIGFSISFC